MWGDMGDDGTQDWDIGDRLQNPAHAGFGNIHHCTTISNEALANAKTFSEMALIARIQVAVPARKLKLGDHSLTGTYISLTAPQTSPRSPLFSPALMSTLK
jgi:hypothetical protein